MQKLSEIVRNIPYKQIDGALYVKDHKTNTCQVCALGGIALSMPNKYKVDQATEEIRYTGEYADGPADYRQILLDAGCSWEQIYNDYQHENIYGGTLYSFIYKLNDHAQKTFAEIADILESKGL